MNKLLVVRIAAASAAAFAFATTSTQAQADQVTRDQVQAELAQLHAAGYDAARGEDVSYPSALIAAEQRVAGQQLAAAQAGAAQGYGGSPDGSTASGRAHRHVTLDNDGMKPVYFGQ
ncbi:DUF4148 domain-containing protein [Burkholderia gladioli]|uniref:DUF4148 domain-containing protein n=1 Tax=Burkholderia gladioli TaxID=28095 RepID=UPI00163F1256|nr:DUF4148 domain-containing protein [Burkholderia gladioli]